MAINKHQVVTRAVIILCSSYLSPELIHYYHYLNFQNNINFKIRCVWVYIFTFIYIQFHSAEIMSSKHFLYGQSAVQIKVNTLFQSRLNTVDEWRALCNTTKHKIIVRQQMMLNMCVVILDMSNKKIFIEQKCFLIL